MWMKINIEFRINFYHRINVDSMNYKIELVLLSHCKSTRSDWLMSDRRSRRLTQHFDALKSRLLIDHKYRTTGSNKPEF